MWAPVPTPRSPSDYHLSMIPALKSLGDIHMMLMLILAHTRLQSSMDAGHMAPMSPSTLQLPGMVMEPALLVSSLRPSCDAEISAF